MYSIKKRVKKSNTMKVSKKEVKDKISHEELYNLIIGDEISWQAIIYELVRSEQLDPLDIDISALAYSFLEKIRQLEEANFFISGKVLLAASILLRLKAERVYERLKYFDEILYGKEEAKQEEEKIYLTKKELPIILPKTPLPRMKKVTLEELMKALNKAIETETRRRRRYEAILKAGQDVELLLPKKTFNITLAIKELYKKIINFLKRKNAERLTFSELVPSQSREDKIATFIPLLHLDTREKITLEQPIQFGEIYIYLFKKLEQLQDKESFSEAEG